MGRVPKAPASSLLQGSGDISDDWNSSAPTRMIICSSVPPTCSSRVLAIEHLGKLRPFSSSCMHLELRQRAAPAGRPAGHNPTAHVEAELSLCTQAPPPGSPCLSHRASRDLRPPSPSPVMTSSLIPPALSYLHHSAFDFPLGQHMSEPLGVGWAQLGGEERKGTACRKGQKREETLVLCPGSVHCGWH